MELFSRIMSIIVCSEEVEMNTQENVKISAHLSFCLKTYFIMVVMTHLPAHGSSIKMEN